MANSRPASTELLTKVAEYKIARNTCPDGYDFWLNAQYFNGKFIAYLNRSTVYFDLDTNELLAAPKGYGQYQSCDLTPYGIVTRQDKWCDDQLKEIPHAIKIPDGKGHATEVELPMGKDKRDFFSFSQSFSQSNYFAICTSQACWIGKATTSSEQKKTSLVTVKETKNEIIGMCSYENDAIAIFSSRPKPDRTADISVERFSVDFENMEFCFQDRATGHLQNRPTWTMCWAFSPTFSASPTDPNVWFAIDLRTLSVFRKIGTSLQTQYLVDIYRHRWLLDGSIFAIPMNHYAQSVEQVTVRAAGDAFALDRAVLGLLFSPTATLSSPQGKLYTRNPDDWRAKIEPTYSIFSINSVNQFILDKLCLLLAAIDFPILPNKTLLRWIAEYCGEVNISPPVLPEFKNFSVPAHPEIDDALRANIINLHSQIRKNIHAVRNRTPIVGLEFYMKQKLALEEFVYLLSLKLKLSECVDKAFSGEMVGMINTLGLVNKVCSLGDSPGEIQRRPGLAPRLHF